MTSEKSHIPFIETKIGDITLMMGIDCGAAVNLIDDSMFSKLEKRMSNISTTELNGASKESTTVKNGDIILAKNALSTCQQYLVISVI